MKQLRNKIKPKVKVVFTEEDELKEYKDSYCLTVGGSDVGICYDKKEWVLDDYEELRQLLYVKGVKGRGKDVIALLEGCGGENLINNEIFGEEEDCYYYINAKTSIIEFVRIDSDAGWIISTFGKNLPLPEKASPFEEGLAIAFSAVKKWKDDGNDKRCLEYAKALKDELLQLAKKDLEEK